MNSGRLMEPWNLAGLTNLFFFFLMMRFFYFIKNSRNSLFKGPEFVFWISVSILGSAQDPQQPNRTPSGSSPPHPLAADLSKHIQATQAFDSCIPDPFGASQCSRRSSITRPPGCPGLLAVDDQVRGSRGRIVAPVPKVSSTFDGLIDRFRSIDMRSRMVFRTGRLIWALG